MAAAWYGPSDPVSIPSASRDATTKIFRCLQTLKCLGRKPSLWVGAFKSLASCKQNPEAISLPLRLSQRTWGGSPKEDEAGGRLKTTEVTHRILTGALGVEGPFALWHFFFLILLIMLLPVSLFPQSLGSTADGPACLKQSESSSQERACSLGWRIVFAEKDSRGSWFLLWCMDRRQLNERQRLALCLVLTFPGLGRKGTERQR